MLRIDIKVNMDTEHGKADLLVCSDFLIGHISGIFGNSGQGKTTLFNIIAGIAQAETGHISFNTTQWYHAKGQINMPIQKRNIAYIFQQHNLFPNFTVKENIEYAIHKKQKHVTDAVDIMHKVGLEAFANKYPYELSGGQQQRVAIARALAQDAQLLLLDEPFTGLDLESRLQLIKQIKTLSAQHKLTVLIISHQVEDLINLCDQIYLLEQHCLGKALSKSEFSNEIQHKTNLLIS
jgi:molybdate transport system ATP-binding protein